MNNINEENKSAITTEQGAGNCSELIPLHIGVTTIRIQFDAVRSTNEIFCSKLKFQTRSVELPLGMDQISLFFLIKKNEIWEMKENVSICPNFRVWNTVRSKAGVSGIRRRR